MSSFKTFLLAGTVALVGMAGVARADSFTQTITFGPGPTDFTSVMGAPQVFGLFDSAGGATLNSITFASTYGFTSSILVTNTSQGAVTGTVRTQSAAKFTSDTSSVTTAFNNRINTLVDPVDGTSVTFGNSTLTPIAYDVRGAQQGFNLAPNQSTTLQSNGSGSTGPTVDTNAADLAAFTSTGTVYVTPFFTTLSGLLLSQSGGNVTATQTTTATGTLSITYNYSLAAPPPTRVPEPTSLAILGAGMLGLGLLRRRKSK